MTAEDLLANSFATLPDLLACHAHEQGGKPALVQGDLTLTYGELHRQTALVVTSVQAAGVIAGGSVAIVSATTVAASVAFLGILRAGCVPVPLAPSYTPTQLSRMIADCGATVVFADADAALALPASTAIVVNLEAIETWKADSAPRPAPIEAEDRFNIIYSSGTTGEPKGIVQTHAMRWAQIKALGSFDFKSSVTIVCTPIYSNTTLVSLLPTLAYGGTVVLLGKFEPRTFLEAAQRHRATHAMLVPIQYQRIMALSDFNKFDLTSFRIKTCTSAPFPPELKADVVCRWPGALIEIYGMTEGGGTSLLMAHAFPDKLHTVGVPAPGNDIRLVDDMGREVATGEIGEIVGRSPAMMSGYHGRAEATDEAEWISKDGLRFIRHGDLGRFDEDGFLTLLGRIKDMIITGGFNVYPPDVEHVLLGHPGVADAAVIGVPSKVWGETPWAYYVERGDGVAGEALMAWVNTRVGKIQRLSGAEAVSQLPRSAIGKVLKRELHDRYMSEQRTKSEKAR
jgi:acyl-CoA synthetase (AMP-forming)/AMP-acid ligase II